MKLITRPARAALLAVGLAACDIPTGIPRWETNWITPGETMTVSVVELLPAGLGVTSDTSAFVLGFDPVEESWQLSDFCDACPPTAIVAPKPAFTTTLSTNMALPSGVANVVVSGGAIDVEVTHGFGFDPLRPGAASDSGSLTITARSNGVSVASLRIDGANQAFAPGDTLRRSLTFIPSTIVGQLVVEFTLDSPAGDVATLDPNAEFGVAVASDGVLVTEAVVAVAGRTISGVESELDLSDVELDRINAGTIFLEIDNPFALSGNLTLTIDPQGAAGPFTRPIALMPGSSETAVSFNEQEIDQILGSVSTLVVQGVVNSSGGMVTVRPDMAITIRTRLRVTIEVGGDFDDDES